MRPAHEMRRFSASLRFSSYPAVLSSTDLGPFLFPLAVCRQPAAVLLSKRRLQRQSRIQRLDPSGVRAVPAAQSSPPCFKSSSEAHELTSDIREETMHSSNFSCSSRIQLSELGNRTSDQRESKGPAAQKKGSLRRILNDEAKCQFQRSEISKMHSESCIPCSSSIHRLGTHSGISSERRVLSDLPTACDIASP